MNEGIRHLAPCLAHIQYTLVETEYNLAQPHKPTCADHPKEKPSLRFLSPIITGANAPRKPGKPEGPSLSFEGETGSKRQRAWRGGSSSVPAIAEGSECVSLPFSPNFFRVLKLNPTAPHCSSPHILARPGILCCSCSPHPPPPPPKMRAHLLADFLFPRTGRERIPWPCLARPTSPALSPPLTLWEDLEQK